MVKQTTLAIGGKDHCTADLLFNSNGCGNKKLCSYLYGLKLVKLVAGDQQAEQDPSPYGECFQDKAHRDRQKHIETQTNKELDDRMTETIYLTV